MLEGARRVILWFNINGCGGCATRRWDPVLPVPGQGILFVEREDWRQGGRPEGFCCVASPDDSLSIRGTPSTIYLLQDKGKSVGSGIREEARNKWVQE